MSSQKKLVSYIRGFRLRNPNVSGSKIARKLGLNQGPVNSWKGIKPTLSYNLILDIGDCD